MNGFAMYFEFSTVRPYSHYFAFPLFKDRKTFLHNSLTKKGRIIMVLNLTDIY